MEIRLVPAYSHGAEIMELFSEYTDMLVEGEPSFRAYLDLQNYEEELRHLEGKYGLPDGRLYLLTCDGEPAGCIGLRKLDDRSCELKRLYVRPVYRGRGLGRLLVERIIADAGEIGYAHLLLDTLPFLETAIRLYRELGFYEIGQYNNSPVETTVYLKLDL